MGKKLFRIAVYPLLLINLVLGFLMFVLSHRFIMVAATVLYQNGSSIYSTLGPFPYVQRTLNSFGAIILGLLLLIFFPILDSYYTRNADQCRSLLYRFLQVVGIQLLYLGTLQLVIGAMIGSPLTGDVGMFLIIGQLAVGVGLMVFTRAQINSAAVRSKQEKG